MLIASVGVPLTNVTSLISTLIVAISPALSVLLSAPVALLTARLVIVGLSVSMLISGVRPSPPSLPAASV